MRPASSMTSRLWRGCIVFAVLAIGSGALIYAGIRYQNAAISDEVQNIHPLEVTALEIQADFANAQAALGAYILTREPQFLHFYRGSRSELKITLSQARDHTRGQLRRDVVAQQREVATWFTFADQVQVLPAGDPQIAVISLRSYPSAAAFGLANKGMLAQLRAQSKLAIDNAHQVLTRAVAGSASLAVLAVLLALLAASGTIRGITRPLRSLTSTVQRLSAGDNAARAELTGSSEARDVALAVNMLADESDRLREQEAVTNRLRAMARETGLRIREHLHADDVIREARVVLEGNLDADVVYLHLIHDGKMGPPEGHEHDWLLPDDFLDSLPPGMFLMLEQLLRNQACQVVQDMPGPDGDSLRPEVRDALRQAGIVSHLLVPFGVGSELLGMIVADRLQAGQPWTAAEIDAVQSIAADLGRGLHHARLYEEENRLVAELKSIDRAKSDFVATVSHELRTPLTSIRGYIEMLLDRDLGELGAEQERTLETVDRNAARLQDLIEDLLTLSAIEAGTFTTVTKPANLLDIIGRAGEEVQPAVLSKGITLTTTGLPDGLIVNGDTSQLTRVLANLLSNAVKFTPAGGQVEVTAVAAGGWAVLSVADTGIGIPDADKKDLFTRFFRASNAMKRAIPGTGLGLAIVQSIVAAHGGDLDLQSHEGHGTTITVRLPLAVPGAPPAAVYQGPERRGAAAASGVSS